MSAFFERYKRLSEYEPSDEELEAGVEVFGNFGFFNTVVTLSRKMSCSYEQVLNMSADEVYMTLLLDFETAEYEKRLTEVRRRNYELQNKARG